MQNLIKHISLFLLAIFMFPVIFQGVHMVLHHHDLTSCLHLEDSGFYETKHSEICLVSLFEFASFDVASVHLIPTTFQYADKFTQQLNNCTSDHYNGYNFALRAPPPIG